MPLNDVVQVTITTESAKVLQPGYGVPLILSAGATFPERARVYEDIDGLESDGFTSSMPEHKAASALFAQNPRPEEVIIGRLVNKPTMRWAVTPVVGNAVTYKLKIDGTEVSYTSDASATATEIIGGLKTAIDALSKAITTSDQTTYLRIVANTAGAWFDVSSPDVSKLGITMDNADPGFATDLSAIKVENNDWYAVLNPYASSAINVAVAAWVETNKKLFLAQTIDSDVLTVAWHATNSLDVGSLLRRAAYARTALIYHPTNNEMAAAAWAGKLLPMDPGSETWAFKTLSGVTAYSLSSTNRSNATTKYVNTYEAIAGLNMTSPGKVSANEWIDTIRFIDWQETDAATGIFRVVANNPKLPYTDAGIAAVAAEVRASLARGVDAGGLADDPAPTVSVPKAADVSAQDKADRILRDITFDATLAGAIHEIRISGRVAL